MENKDCVFCKIVKREIKADIVEESNSFIAMLDVNPLSSGHTLIIPKQHWVTMLDIPNKYGNELLELIKKVSGKLMEEKKGNGFNILMNNLSCAGQKVMHAHLHIIPRNEGDGLKSFA